jgi:hypothetical protein
MLFTGASWILAIQQQRIALPRPVHEPSLHYRLDDF